MILKLLAAIVTGIGGHYLNRRWDKAIFFLGLFILYLTGLYLYMIYALQHITATADNIATEFEQTTDLVLRAAVGGTFVLWLASVAVTLRDNRRKIAPTFEKWTPYALIGATITCLMAMAILAYSALSFNSLTNGRRVVQTPANGENVDFDVTSHNFFEYLYLGDVPENSYSLPAPPQGKGVLKGHFIYQGEPAAGITLTVFLNSEYRVKSLVTDERGEFSIPLPPGHWTINAIQTEGWQGKPEGNKFSLYYGGEEKLTGTHYQRHGFFPKEGFPVEVTSATDIVHIDIIINPDIKLLWPDPDRERTSATIADTIRWETYPGAARFYLEINHLTRERNSTTYTPVTARILPGNVTTLPLAELKHVPTDAKNPNEYAATVYAFATDGTLIGEFSETFEGGTFLLEGQRLLEDEIADMLTSGAIADSDRAQQEVTAIDLNRHRTDAVEVLLDERLLDEAQALLQLVESGYAQGRKELLAGYLSARRGDCATAAQHFEDARRAKPDICIPNDYHVNCR